jgi:hypothetical protein
MAKVRVHELARELGVTSKDILGRLNELGEYVKSASSVIEAPLVRKFRSTMGSAAPKGSGAADLTSVAEALGVDLPARQRRGRSRRAPGVGNNPRPVISRRGQIDERAAVLRWAKRWIDEAQMREWRKAGLGVFDDAVAERCIEAGISPEELGIRIDGQTVASRLRGGEPVSAVAIQLRATKNT